MMAEEGNDDLATVRREIRSGEPGRENRTQMLEQDRYIRDPSVVTGGLPRWRGEQVLQQVPRQRAATLIDQQFALADATRRVREQSVDRIRINGSDLAQHHVIVVKRGKPPSRYRRAGPLNQHLGAAVAPDQPAPALR